LEWRDYQPDGNGDGIPEAGETVGMRIRLANLSGERVRNINAILSSTLPSVTIRQNQLSYGDLEPGGDAWDQSSNLTFDFSTETDVPFHLRATYRKGEANYYQEWDFTVHVWAQGSHPAQFLIHRVVVLRSARGTANSGAVGTLGSGEEADFVLYLKNTGTAHATHVSATLQNVLPAGVDLPVGPRDYEDLLAGGTEQPPQNGQDWYIRRIPRNYLGPITANLVVTYGLGELRQTNRVTLFDVKPAKWIYVSPPSINFGVSPSSQQITRDVTVENTGSDLLTVSSITVSSAFSDVTWSGPGLPWLVPVGGSRTIQVSINPAHLQNQISRTLIFNSDGMAYDPRDCSVTLVGWVYDGTRVYELPTTSFARDLYGADVSGDIIVWSDTRNATSDIYGYDIAKGVEFPICTNAAAQSQPRISGDLVVWNDWRNSPSGPGQAGNCDIYGYDLNKKREIVISSDPANEQLIGVDHGKVAFRREYYHISEASKDGELGVYNLWLLDYASGSLDNVTGFRPNSSHAPMTKVSKCDFGNGILVWSEHTLTWDAGAAGGPRWIITNPWTKVICNDGVVTEALARPPMGYPSADQCRFAYIQGYGPSGEEHVFVWPDHVVDPITTKPVMSEECLALSGNLVFYNKTGIDGVFVYDLSSRQESLFTTQKGVAGLRLDGRTAVWNSWDNQARQLRVYLSFVQQADIAVAPENILVSKIAPIEGEAVTVSATVQNLTQYPSSGDITVRLYLGNPDSGSAELAPPCVIAGGLPAQGQSKIEFPAVVLSKHGTNQIYVRIYPSTPDFGGNNTASKEVVVVSAPGTDGPAVVGFTVTELDGDGDGKVGSDEHVNISWSLADASGIGAVSLLVDGAPFPVTSNGCFSANLGPMSAGAHTAVIVATDADDSPESSTNEFTFAVLRAENVIVRYAGEVVTNKSAISLGTLTLSGNAAAILTILNQGEQPLVIINITVTPGLGLIQPAMSRLEPGNSTVFPVFPDTSRAGAFTGQVAFATSDLRNSPLIFTISWTVAQALPSLQYGRQGGSVILMWSTNAVGYALEATAALLPSQWKPVADAPGVKGDQNVLTISPTSPSNFYRLRKQ
jgi:beta propeller repeat protein